MSGTSKSKSKSSRNPRSTPKPKSKSVSVSKSKPKSKPISKSISKPKSKRVYTGPKAGTKEAREKFGQTKFKEEYIKLAYVACSEMGADIEKLANLFGVDKQTIYNWMSNFPEFFDVVKDGRDYWDNFQVERALVSRAMGYTVTEKKTRSIEISQGRGRNRVTVPATEVTNTERHIPPEPSCLFFWLHNRSKGRFKNSKFVVPQDKSPEETAREIQGLVKAMSGSVPLSKGKKKNEK